MRRQAPGLCAGRRADARSRRRYNALSDSITVRRSTSFLARHSRAYVYFASRVDAALRQTRIADRADWKGYYGALYDDAGVRRVGAALERLAQHCRSRNVPLFTSSACPT